MLKIISAKSVTSVVLAVLLNLIALSVTTAHSATVDDMVFFQNDHLGSAIVAVNENGDICWNETYTPYGDKTLDEDVGFGSPAGCGLLGQERGYTGHTEDAESGLTYMQQRFYDPSIGRFLSIDPMPVDTYDYRTVNRYSYAFNSPYRYTDPNGMHAADGIESVQGSPKDIEIETGVRDGWGNRVPGYSEGDSDEFHSRFKNSKHTWNPAIEPFDILSFLVAPQIKVPWLAGSLIGASRLAKVAKVLADPKTIRFSHDSIKSTFRDGRSVKDLAAGLKNGSIKPGDVPAIRTVQRNGQTVSIDNRRLAAFREAGVPIRTRPATAKEIAQAQRQGKFSAGASGTDNIQIRGQ